MTRFDEIRQLYDDHGFPFYDQKNALNLYGIRTGYEVVDLWNDILGMAFVDEFGNQVCIEHVGTTKPGLYWLKNRLGSVNGTFILMEGHFRHCFEVRKHKGEYDALCQVYGYKGFHGPRDNDSDGEFDLDTEWVNDVTGLNMHHGKDRQLVGPYSAACQVRQSPEDHAVLMAVARKCLDYWNAKKLSYSLFTISN